MLASFQDRPGVVAATTATQDGSVRRQGQIVLGHKWYRQRGCSKCGGTSALGRGRDCPTQIKPSTHEPSFGHETLQRG
jgi:hypothetical protein